MIGNVAIINANEYYSVNEFARIINRSAITVYRLTTEGNSVGKLKKFKFAGKIFIPASELTEFTFVTTGSKAKKYKFKIVEDINTKEFWIQKIFLD